MKAAIIGCGQIGSRFAAERHGDEVVTHAQAYQSCPGTELAAVCDVDVKRAEHCARRWNVPCWFGDALQMMEQVHPDIVSICTPDETHAALILSMLAASRRPPAILCEKPLALSVADARQVWMAAEQAGVRLAVNYSRRYAASLQALRRLINSGELGGVQAIHGWYTKGVIHNGTHWFDLLRFLVGEASQVTGRTAHDADQPDPGLDVSIHLAGGALAHLISCDSRKFTVFEMDIMLERGRVELRQAALHPRLWRAGPSARHAGYVVLLEDSRALGDARNPILHAVEDLVDAVQTGRSPLCSASDGVAALIIAEAALNSARSGGQPVLTETI